MVLLYVCLVRLAQCFTSPETFGNTAQFQFHVSTVPVQFRTAQYNLEW